jgi:large subunit ribosomal protein L13
MNNKTFSPKAADLTHAWWVVDATDLPLGRLASEVARLIRGKHKPTFAPHVDGGDHVIVVNATKVAITSDKSQKKIYYRHSGFPGGLKEETFEALLARRPEQVIERAVKGNASQEPSRYGRCTPSSRCIAGPDHPHEAQMPQVLELPIRKAEA